VDWLKAQFAPKADQNRIKTNYNKPIIFLLDGDANHKTIRRTICAGSQKIIIRLAAHLPRVSQPFDLYVFVVLKTLHKREKRKGQ
jgi:hypothetical protein